MIPARLFCEEAIVFTLALSIDFTEPDDQQTNLLFVIMYVKIIFKNGDNLKTYNHPPS